MSISNIIVYGFENKNSEPTLFMTLDFHKAVNHARKHGLKMVQHNYEWADQVAASGHDYTTETAGYEPAIARDSRPIPSVGTRILLDEIDRFPEFVIPEGEIAVVSEIDLREGQVWVKLERHHECLDQYGNGVLFISDAHELEGFDIEEKENCLRRTFWSEVDSVLE